MSVGDFNVAGKVVAITGGVSGVHLELAKLVQAKGAKVLIADLKLSKEAESIVNGSNVVFLETNVAHWADLQRIITASKERFGDVPDVYVAGAGIFEPAPMYSTTKHALVGFTRSMGDLDTHEGVKVVTICPGIINTPLWKTNPSASARFGYHDSISISGGAGVD